MPIETARVRSVTADRQVRVARLPEMRLAYLEHEGAAAGIPELWERFNAWRLQHRPALGRIDIAGIGWMVSVDEDDAEIIVYRTALPIRSDYEAPPPARTTFFPGALFAYCYADDADEVDDATAAVAEWLGANGYEPRSGPLEVYRFHFNLEQHPSDCGFLVEQPGGEPLPPRGARGPLQVARDPV